MQPKLRWSRRKSKSRRLDPGHMGSCPQAGWTVTGAGISRPMVLWTCLLLFLLIGCGKKGPPVPPQAPPPPRAVKLGIIGRGAEVVLQWQIEPGAATRVRSFQVLQAVSPAGDRQCRGCPQVFHPVGVVDQDAGNSGKYSLQIRIRPGFNYTFKVRSMGIAAGLFVDSATVTYPGGE